MDNVDRSTAVFNQLSDVQYAASVDAHCSRRRRSGVWQAAFDEANLSAGAYYVILGAGVEAGTTLSVNFFTPFL